MAVLLEEMEAVLQGQKKVSAVADKAQWWEGRKALDARVQVKDCVSHIVHSLICAYSLVLVLHKPQEVNHLLIINLTFSICSFTQCCFVEQVSNHCVCSLRRGNKCLILLTLYML